jgi:hypothetical protein
MPPNDPVDRIGSLHERVKQLRGKADEAREIAALIERADMRARLLTVARDWDLEADWLEA